MKRLLLTEEIKKSNSNENKKGIVNDDRKKIKKKGQDAYT